MPNPFHIQLKDVSYQVRGRVRRTLLSEVDLQITRGELVSLAGPNGAGKTTLLQLLSGLILPSKGQVLYENKPLHTLSPRSRAKKIAVVSQNEQPDSRLTVYDYVKLGSIPHEHALSVRQKEAEVAHAIELMAIGHLAGKTMDSLSGGEQQRVIIARSLCQKPEALFLDEPTNHLDPRAKGEILSIIAGLEITIIAVLHELSLAAAFADRVVILEDGKIITAGVPEQSLSPETVRSVFGVDIFHFQHPVEKREIVCLDIPLKHKKKKNYEKETV